MSKRFSTPPTNDFQKSFNKLVDYEAIDWEKIKRNKWWLLLVSTLLVIFIIWRCQILFAFHKITGINLVSYCDSGKAFRLSDLIGSLSNNGVPNNLVVTNADGSLSKVELNSNGDLLFETLPSIPGAPGAPGADGIDGLNGTNGIPGPQGPQGNSGAQGNPGSNGANGTNGSNGTNGLPGAIGPMGPAGPAGPPGPLVLTNTLVNDGINTLTSTVNGVADSDVIINTNVLGLAGTDLTSTVNGVVSNILDLSSIQGITSINTTATGPNVDIIGDTNEITISTIGNVVNVGLATNPIIPGVTPCSAGVGAVTFADGPSGALTTDTSNLCWNNTTNMLGINTSNPQTRLDFGGTGGDKVFLYNAGVAGSRYGMGINTNEMQMFVDGTLFTIEGAGDLGDSLTSLGGTDDTRRFVMNTSNGNSGFNFDYASGGNSLGPVSILHLGAGENWLGSGTGGLTMDGSVVIPPVSLAGKGRIYFDAGLNQFLCSENGSAYSPCFPDSLFSINTTATGPNVDIIGTPGETTVTTFGNTITLGLDPNIVCPGSLTTFCQDGNSFGTRGMLGTNDAFDQAFETNSLERMRLTQTGRMLFSNTSAGNTNLFVGQNTGNETVTGANNIGIGSTALGAVTTGTVNLAIGRNALGSNTSGFGNLAIGDGALDVATSNNNLAIGWDALGANLGVGNNLAIGTRALQSNTTGTPNLAIGRDALAANTTGTFNLGIGVSSLASNTTGTINLAIGSNAMGNNTTGFTNSGIGRNALFSNTTGNNNIGFGDQALYTNSTGISNLAIGANALFNNTVDNNIAIGDQALDANTTGTPNIAIGRDALGSNTTGNDNIAMGLNSLDSSTTGNNNIAIGTNTLTTATTQVNNIAIGARALSNLSGGIGFSDLNVAIGTDAGRFTTTGEQNVALGNNAMRDNTTGARNVYIGSGSGDTLTSGNNNVGLGYGTLSGSGAGGNENTALGSSSMIANNSGSQNTALGSASLRFNTSGSRNISLGRLSMGNNVTGSSNIAIGNNTLASIVGVSDQLAIGHDALVMTTVAGNFAIGHNSLDGIITQTGNFAIGNNTLSNSLNVANNNFAIGDSALERNTTGTSNMAIGNSVLTLNSTGSNNVAIGMGAALALQSGDRNTVVGNDTASILDGGSDNSFFGNSTGTNSTTGSFNSIFGSFSGMSNTVGNFGSFFGYGSGLNNTTGTNNSFFGNSAGNQNITGNNNYAFGANSGPTSSALSNAGAIGHRAVVDCSNCMVLGSVNGFGGSTDDTSVGIGVTYPLASLHIASGSVGATGTNGFMMTGISDGIATTPALSNSDSFRMYYEDTTDEVLCSVNGGLYTSCFGGSFPLTGANNGLSVSGTTVQLGGPLIQNTTITNNGFDLLFTGTGNGSGKIATFAGDVDIQGVIDPTAILFSDSGVGSYNPATTNGFKIGNTGAFNRPIYVSNFANTTDTFQVRRADDTTVVMDVDAFNQSVGVRGQAGTYSLTVHDTTTAGIRMTGTDMLFNMDRTGSGSVFTMRNNNAGIMHLNSNNGASLAFAATTGSSTVASQMILDTNGNLLLGGLSSLPTNTYRQIIRTWNGTNNSILPALQLYREVTGFGAGASGIGTSLDFQTKGDDGNAGISGRVVSAFDDAGSIGVDDAEGSIRLNTSVNGVDTEGLRVVSEIFATGSGAGTNTGIGGITSPWAQLTVGGTGAGGNAGIQWEGVATAPALSTAGDGRIYFNSTSNQFECSINAGAYSTCITAMGGGVTTANNGLSLSGTTVQLGGPLIQNTTITNNGFDLIITGTGNGSGKLLTVEGDMDVQGVIDPTALLFSDSTVGSYDEVTNNGFRIGVTGATQRPIYVSPMSNNTRAFEVRNAALTTTVLDVDTTNTRVGINTSAPLAQLHLANISNAPFDGTKGIRLTGSSINAIWEIGDASVTGSGNFNATHFGNISNNGMSIITNNEERIRIGAGTGSGSGYVGIGNVNPVSNLHVGDNNDSLSSLRLTNANQGHTAADGFELIVSNATSQFVNHDTGGFEWYTVAAGVPGASFLRMNMDFEGHLNLNPDHAGGASTVTAFTVLETITTSNQTQPVRGIDVAFNDGAFDSTNVNMGLRVDMSGLSGGTNYSGIFLGGNIGIGNSAPGQALDVTGTIRQSNAVSCNLTTNASGDISCISDETKKDIQGGYTGGLSELLKIQTIKFNYKGESYQHIGFSAQNVATVLPQAAPIQRDGTLGFDSNAVLALTVNSIQEQQSQITTLKLDVDGLKLDASSSTTSSTTTPTPTDNLSILSLITNTINDFFNNISEFTQNIFFKGRLTFADKDLAGFARIKAGAESVKVSFKTAYATEPIVNATQKSGQAVAYTIEDSSTTGFTIKLSKSASTEINFNWMAVAIKDASTFESESVSVNTVPQEINEPQTVLPTSTPTDQKPSPTNTQSPLPTQEPSASIPPAISDTPSTDSAQLSVE